MSSNDTTGEVTHGQERESGRLLIQLVALIIGLSYWSIPALDPDTPWHLLGGAEMVDTGRVPVRDHINAFNPFWHDYSWLFQLPVYYLYTWGGIDAERYALAAVMVLLQFQVLEFLFECLPGRRRYPAVILVFVFYQIYISSVEALRPQIIALPILLMVVNWLRKPARRFEVPLLFLVAATLSNMHVYWLLLPVIYFCMRLLPKVVNAEPGQRQALAGVIFLSAAALVSPYSFLTLVGDRPFIFVNYALLWEYMSQSPYLANHIGEMLSGFSGDGLSRMGLLLFVALYARYFPRRRVARLHVGAVALGTVGFILTTRSVKFEIVFATLALPLLAVFARGAVRELTGVISLERLTLLTNLLLVGLAMRPANALVTKVPALYPSAPLITTYRPEGACRAIAKDYRIGNPGYSPLALVVTHFDSGAWCRWFIYDFDRSTGLRISTDGRVQRVPVSMYQQSFDLFELKGPWEKTLKDWRPEYVLSHKVMPLARELLGKSDDWQVLYHDSSFMVFKRRPRAFNEGSGHRSVP